MDTFKIDWINIVTDSINEDSNTNSNLVIDKEMKVQSKDIKVQVQNRSEETKFQMHSLSEEMKVQMQSFSNKINVTYEPWTLNESHNN